MDGGTKALTIIGLSLIAFLFGVIAIGIWTSHAQVIACIESGKEVIGGQCVARTAP
jgi:hypothetical protein